MEVISTSITNLDIHDISRVSRTYGVKQYFLVHPLDAQQNLAKEMLGYWREGYGGEYNPDRKDALEVLEVISDLDAVLARIEELEGTRPRTVATDARIYPQTTGYKELREKIEEGSEPYLVLFGTGWGITSELIGSCDYVLEPIEGGGEYNHLSVRSAVAIILDRLLGDYWWKK